MVIWRLPPKKPVSRGDRPDWLERETGFEPATSTLARLHSTTELFPRVFVLVGWLPPKKPVSRGDRLDWLERETGFEPATSTLARLHSTTELFPPVEATSGFEPENGGFADLCLTTWLCRRLFWSGKRDLNPRLQPWQGCTLPLSYSRPQKRTTVYPCPFQVSSGFYDFFKIPGHMNDLFFLPEWKDFTFWAFLVYQRALIQ